MFISSKFPGTSQKIANKFWVVFNIVVFLTAIFYFKKK